MSKPGYIYVAKQWDEPRLCKIGQTIDVRRREGTLKGGTYGRKLEIVESVWVNDMDTVERAFHTILKYRIAEGHREWFRIEAKYVLPMLRCVGNAQERPQVHEAEIPAPSSMASGRGNWHEDGWRMHCRGETQAQIAKKFGVSEGAVVAMKKKMRALDRGDEEANRRQRPVTGTGRQQRTTTSNATPQSAFRQPIVDILLELGGSAQAGEVLRRLKGKMGCQLGPKDRKRLKNGQEVWMNKAQWARQKLKEEGVLKPDSRRGWWELA